MHPPWQPTSNAKDEFYDILVNYTCQYPSNEALVILGDFNSQVGEDQTAWLDSLRHFRTGKMNKNGLSLLELCLYHELCITNTFCGVKPHPGLMDQLDLAIAKQSQLSSVKSSTCITVLTATQTTYTLFLHTINVAKIKFYIS